MKLALIYYYWNDSKKNEVWRDLENPIIPSIATFRSNNTQIPIYVIDCSNQYCDWSYFPFKLKFEVVRQAPYFGHDPSYGLTSNIMKLFSRAYDVPMFAEKLDENLIAFCDSDIFWIKDLLPLPHINGFYCNKLNNGFYYYSKGDDANHFFSFWQQTIKEGLENTKKRQEIMMCYYASIFNDEAAYVYVKQNSNLIKELSFYENYSALRLDLEAVENTKNIHLCRSNYGTKRGMIALLIKEIYDNMTVMLDQKDLIRIFGESNACLARMFGLNQLYKANLFLNKDKKVLL